MPAVEPEAVALAGADSSVAVAAATVAVVAAALAATAATVARATVANGGETSMTTDQSQAAETDDFARTPLPDNADGAGVDHGENGHVRPVIAVRRLSKLYLLGKTRVPALRGGSLDIYPREV